MSLWIPMLAASLAAPLLGWLWVRRGAARMPSGRRGLGAAWHLGSISLWTVTAALVAAPGASGRDWGTGSAAAVLALGLIWVEALYLAAKRTYSQPAGAEPGGSSHTGADFHRNGTSGAFEDQGSGGQSGTLDRRAEEDDFQQEDRERGEADEEEVILPPEAEALLQRILGLGDLPVETIMSDRERIDFVDGSLPAHRALLRMAETRRSRLPVVADGSLDRILGVVHAKDLVPLVLEDPRRAPVRNYLRRWLRVPQGQSVARLLEDFRRNRAHIGVVGDPLGRTKGLVTLGDIFRHIAGAGADGSEERGRGGRS